MAPDQTGAGFHHLVMAAVQYFLQHSHIKVFGWKHHDIKGCQRSASHGIDIGNGVGSGDLAEPVRIVNRGCNKINSVDHGDFSSKPVNRGIISGLKTDQQVRIRWWSQTL